MGNGSDSLMVCSKIPQYTLMYSFAQRDDVEVLDEPPYANFLRLTGLDRPYRHELLSKMESDGNKHISKQRVLGLSEDLMKKGKGKHFILIRNPLDILPSFDKVVPPSFFELSLAELVCIYNEFSEIEKPPPVIDAAELEKDPEATLRGLCNDLEIPFQPAMLSHFPSLSMICWSKVYPFTICFGIM